MTTLAVAPAPSPPPPPAVFGALRHRNFRLFIMGQLVSVTGTWMQTIAQGWLVLQLSQSAFVVGLVTTLGSLPVLLLTLYGGVVADRVNKRQFVTLLQALMLLDALALAILTALGLITVGWVIVLAVLFGTCSAFEIPARQAFLAEMVGKDDLMNAIALNSTAFNMSRVIGPVIAGVLIATVGLAACFFLNAASYLAVVVMLLLMRFPPRAPTARESAGRSFREGVRYILGHRQPRMLSLLTAVFSVFGFSFAVMLPVYAERGLGTGAQGYGALMSSVGVGAVVGALFLAAFRGRLDRDRVVYQSAALFGLSLALAAALSNLVPALVVLMLAGGSWALTSILTNTLLQTRAPDRLRGRVMGFYAFMVVGMAPFGALQAGWVAERFGIRASLALGGVVCLVTAAMLGWPHLRAGAGPSVATSPPPSG